MADEKKMTSWNHEAYLFNHWPKQVLRYLASTHTSSVFFLFQLLFCNFSFNVVIQFAYEDTSWILNLERNVWVAACVEFSKCIMVVFFRSVDRKASWGLRKSSIIPFNKCNCSDQKRKKSHKEEIQKIFPWGLTTVCANQTENLTYKILGWWAANPFTYITRSWNFNPLKNFCSHTKTAKWSTRKAGPGVTLSPWKLLLRHSPRCAIWINITLS